MRTAYYNKRVVEVGAQGAQIFCGNLENNLMLKRDLGNDWADVLLHKGCLWVVRHG